MERERQQSSSWNVGDDMDTSENIIHSVQRPEDIQPQTDMVEHGTEDGAELLETSLGPLGWVGVAKKVLMRNSRRLTRLWLNLKKRTPQFHNQWLHFQ